MDKITTTYHAYKFWTDNPEEAQQYAELKAKLKAQGLSCFETWGQGSHYNPDLDGKELTLETACLFDNQWNTAPVEGLSESGYRVFDWAQDYPINMSKKLKQGHYLDQSPAMAEVRRNTLKCGYCGKQEPAAAGYVFCPACLDSEYLKETELHLTRMVSVLDSVGEGRTRLDDRRPKREPLTEAEAAHLIPLYRDAQLHGNTDRGRARKAARAEIKEKAEKAVANAEAERDGFLWLLAHNVKIDNVIYYSHTGMFSFGWRSPVSAGLKSDLLDILAEFKWPYEIKSEAGDVSTVAA